MIAFPKIRGVRPVGYEILSRRVGDRVTFTYVERFAPQHRRAFERSVRGLAHLPLPRGIRLRLTGNAVRISGTVSDVEFADQIASEFLGVGSFGKITVMQLFRAAVLGGSEIRRQRDLADLERSAAKAKGRTGKVRRTARGKR